MEYSDYKQIAIQYIIDEKGSLDVLKLYNNTFEEKVKQHMLKQILQYCGTNSSETKNAINKNKNYRDSFIKEYRR